MKETERWYLYRGEDEAFYISKKNTESGVLLGEFVDKHALIGLLAYTEYSFQEVREFAEFIWKNRHEAIEGEIYGN